SGKVIPQLKDRIGTTIVTHYPSERDLGMQITREQAMEDGIDELNDRFPVVVPRFM
ncbi:MAG TPA: magnesium chelatase, partial [Phycisphaerales bacterium]|nr:magnesium chelatase [Phycisphaerales bacterium]